MREAEVKRAEFEKYYGVEFGPVNERTGSDMMFVTSKDLPQFEVVVVADCNQAVEKV